MVYGSGSGTGDNQPGPGPFAGVAPPTGSPPGSPPRTPGTAGRRRRADPDDDEPLSGGRHSAPPAPGPPSRPPADYHAFSPWQRGAVGDGRPPAVPGRPLPPPPSRWTTEPVPAPAVRWAPASAPEPAGRAADTRSGLFGSADTYQALLGALGVLVLLAVCGFSSWLIVLDERKGTDARAAGAPEPTVVPRDISSREVDPEPLTAKEVFPTDEIVVTPDEPPYKVLKRQATKDCRVAAAGEMAKLLSTLGCSQVVRATLRSPTGDYLVTGGIFNLEDAAGTGIARDKIRPIVDDADGRFSGLVAGKGTEPIATSSAHVGWDTRGHYLLYCVIARSDGRKFADDDPYAAQILYDIVELHLRDAVLEKRAVVTPASGG